MIILSSWRPSDNQNCITFDIIKLFGSKHTQKNPSHQTYSKVTTFSPKKKVFVHLSKFPIVATGKSITPINCDKHCPPVGVKPFQPSRGKPTKSAEILDRKPRITFIATSSLPFRAGQNFQSETVHQYSIYLT